MHDGDMMRINSHMSRRARQILRGWANETGLAADEPLSALDGVSAEDVEWHAIRMFWWLLNPRRKLATDLTLAELASSDLADYEEEANLRMGGFAWQVAERGRDSGSRGPLRTALSPARTGGVSPALARPGGQAAGCAR